MRSARTLVLSLGIVALWAAARPQAIDVVVRGMVTDSGGKPIAAALVKATLGSRSVSRYTGADGRYELTVPAGTYALSAEAFGYATERRSKDTADASAANFTLAPSWSVTELLGSDIDALIPDDHAGSRLLKSTCINCHALDVMLRRRGATAAQWRTYVEKQMPLRYGRPFTASAAEWTVITNELERWFGPKGQYFGPGAEPPKPEQVRRPTIAPAVARATWYEYTLPNPRTMPHSLAVDRAGRVWIAGWDAATNAVLRFDPAVEQFRSYPVPTPNAVPHTPCVSRDGRVWMALNARGTAKAAVIDPKTDQLTEIRWDAKQPGTHNCQEDRDGHLWFSSLGESDEGFYSMGLIVRVNPRTGETKEYFAPDTPQIRGVMVDSQDNVWFAAFDNHKVGRLNPKTGEFTFYQPPTAKASPYSFVEDRRRGVIWFGDLNGNNLTRFDPRTETFVEYPFPSRNVNPRLGIGIDPQGRIWFTQFLNGRIGALDPGDLPRTPTSSRSRVQGASS
ncbi:MAG: carboxypeptidase regulatory-like domain-containing protein [Acidobacteria bacterium]|nr:carboxypeptidase regulatory-like domain-containing protein [Acidobacteriota bacterium]